MNQKEDEKPNPRAYKIVMSKGDPIHIDVEEIQIVAKAIQTGQPCLVKQGLFNPSYYVQIVEDGDRLSEFWHEWHRAADNNRQARMYGGNERPYPQLVPLKDIFAGVQLKLPAPKK